MTDNSWSDDENDEEIQLKQDSRDFPPSDSESDDEEDYNEMMKIINSKKSQFDLEYNDDNIKKKNSPETTIKKKNIKNNKKYIDFDMTKINKSNKWVSRRMQDKKGPEKRKFNPRFPPPTKKSFNK